MDERFWSKVNKEADGGCWEWIGNKDRAGYGLYGGVRKVTAHRLAFIEVNGPVPAGLELDHLCRNRACVRPDHMQPVTHRENMLRGNGWAGVNARKTHCPRGHGYTPENTKVSRGGRMCRTCLRVANAKKCRKRRARIRAKRMAAGWVPRSGPHRIDPV